MSKSLGQVLKNKTPHSKALYTIMGHRSDGDIMKGKGPKPRTKVDHQIHHGHIVDSGQYNLRHDFDHTSELVFDYDRLNKEAPQDANSLKKQTKRILNPVWKKMGLKLSDVVETK